MNGRTDGRTDRQTETQTAFYTEIHGRIEKPRTFKPTDLESQPLHRATDRDWLRSAAMIPPHWTSSSTPVPRSSPSSSVAPPLVSQRVLSTFAPFRCSAPPPASCEPAGKVEANACSDSQILED